MSRRTTLSLAVAAIVGIAAPAGSQHADHVRWAWSGGVTSSSAVVKASVSRGGAAVRLELVRAGGGAPLPPREVVSDAHGVADVELHGLEPQTRYEYRVSTNGSPAVAGAFRTFGEGPFGFRLVFSSCADSGSTSTVFDAIRNTTPDLFIHTGDLHYEDIPRNEPARFRRAFDMVMGSPAQSRLYRAVPIAYTWDDHDFGGNGSDATSRARPAALSVYRQMVPHYPLQNEGREGIHQAFTIGRVRVIISDSRSQRSPGRHAAEIPTMLGAAQLQWLLEELSSSAGAPLVIWVNTVPWIAAPGSGSDNWGAYAREREQIANHIERLGLTSRLVMLSGDAHMVALDDGTHSNYAMGGGRRAPGFVVMHAAPLDRKTSVKGGPYSHGVSAQRGQFGLVDVTDNGTTLRAELSGRDRAGAPISGMRLDLSCDGEACRIDRQVPRRIARYQVRNRPVSRCTKSLAA